MVMYDCYNDRKLKKVCHGKILYKMIGRESLPVIMSLLTER